MLLDTATLALLLAIILLLQALGWLVIWKMQPDTPGVKFAVAAAGVIVPGFIFVSLRGNVSPWISEVLANYFGVGGLVFSVMAVSRFGHRSPPIRLLAIGYAANLVAWPVHAIFAPGEPGTLAMLAGCFSCYFALLNARECWGAQRTPQVIARLLASLHLGHAAVMALRIIDGAAYLMGRPAFILPAELQNLWFLEFILYAILFFFGLVAMLGSRMSFDLAERNRALQAEALERANLQAQLSAALDEEVQARREQKHFIDMVSHEFRTPLAVVDRAAEMMALSLASQEGAAGIRGDIETVAAMRGEAGRLRLLIESFLAEERLESGLVAPKAESVSIVDLLERLQADRHETLNGGPERLSILSETEADDVVGDSDLLTMVFANLIDTALKSSSEDQPVTLRVSREGRHVVTTLTDRGGDYEGAAHAALGLLAAGRLLRIQGGRLERVGEPGQGMILTVLMPAAARTED